MTRRKARPARHATRSPAGALTGAHSGALTGARASAFSAVFVAVCVTAVVTVFVAACGAAERRPSGPPAPELGLVAGGHERELLVDGREHNYLVYVPETLDLSQPAPVVLAYHGGGSNAERMRAYSGLDTSAWKYGFAVVYPEGTGRLLPLRTWNGGNCCGYAMEQDVDDVAFTRALLDDLATVLHVDGRRVYATGMSNGAIMAYRLAAELSGRIAAIAPVAGTLGVPEPEPARPVPVLHVHGTADEHVPWGGGVGIGVSGTDFVSVHESLRVWRELNGCPVGSSTFVLPDREDDGMRVTRTTWGPGLQDSEVVLITVQGGGHTWPGHDPGLRVLGRSTRDVDVNDLIWEFFRAHPMPEGGSRILSGRARQEAGCPLAARVPRPSLLGAMLVGPDVWPAVEPRLAVDVQQRRRRADTLRAERSPIQQTRSAGEMIVAARGVHEVRIGVEVAARIRRARLVDRRAEAAHVVVHERLPIAELPPVAAPERVAPQQRVGHGLQ
jgi:polyhydroxybutyrate depolymerase